MVAEISVPLLLTLLCEVNPLLLGISAAAARAHEATAIWDVRSAVDGGREVRPALTDYHARDRCGFTPPGHWQGRGADPRTRAAIGEDAFRSDLLSTAGLDDRRSSHGSPQPHGKEHVSRLP